MVVSEVISGKEVEEFNVAMFFAPDSAEVDFENAQTKRGKKILAQKTNQKGVLLTLKTK